MQEQQPEHGEQPEGILIGHREQRRRGESVPRNVPHREKSAVIVETHEVEIIPGHLYERPAEVAAREPLPDGYEPRKEPHLHIGRRIEFLFVTPVLGVFHIKDLVLDQMIQQHRSGL